MRFLVAAFFVLLLAACASRAPQDINQQFRWVADKAQAEGRLDVTPSSVYRVRSVFAQLRATVERDYPEAKAWSWKIHVAHYDNKNVYAFPGGEVVMFQGFLTALKPTDDELAMTLAHEIAHVLLKHPQASDHAYRTQASSAQQRAARRNMELEADRVGLDIATRAGYKPEAMTSLFVKWRAIQGDFSDADGWYPNWQRRIEHIGYAGAARK